MIFLIDFKDRPDVVARSKVPIFADDSKCYHVIATRYHTVFFKQIFKPCVIASWDIKFNVEIGFAQKRSIE